MYGALTEHRLCFRKAQLCTAKELLWGSVYFFLLDVDMMRCPDMQLTSGF